MISISVIIDPLIRGGEYHLISFDMACMTWIYRPVIIRRVFHLRYLDKSMEWSDWRYLPMDVRVRAVLDMIGKTLKDTPERQGISHFKSIVWLVVFHQ